MDAAIMWQAFGKANLHLGGKSVMLRINRRANNREKTRINEGGSADNDKITQTLGVIAGRLGHPINITPFHNAT